jgi:hypothetical protein
MEENTSLYKIEDPEVISLLKSKSSTYFDILFYNCFNIDTNELDLEKFSATIDDIIEVYNMLFDLGLNLAGFQFIGLFLQETGSESITLDVKFAYFILSMGYIIAMFGVLLSFITVEYFRGCRYESPEFIIVGANSYKWIFKFSDIILYTNCFFFLAPINILIHKSVGSYFGFLFNAFCIMIMIVGTFLHTRIIVSKQAYDLPIKLKLLFSLWGNKKRKYQRKLYKIQ